MVGVLTAEGKHASCAGRVKTSASTHVSKPNGEAEVHVMPLARGRHRAEVSTLLTWLGEII